MGILRNFWSKSHLTTFPLNLMVGVNKMTYLLQNDSVLLFCFGFVGCFSFHLDLGIIFVVKISASKDSTPFLSVSDSDLTNTFLILASFGWSMLFFAGSADVLRPNGFFTLVIRVCKSHEVNDSSCTSFAFKTALYGPWEKIWLLIWLIFYFVLVACTVYLCDWVYCEEAHPFSVF
jgi:hypothetical protein